MKKLVIVFAATEQIVLAIALEKVLEETKKLRKISDRFKTEIGLLENLQVTIEAGTTDQFDEIETSLLARGLELATKSARKLKKIEGARFKKELETIEALQIRFGIIEKPVEKPVKTKAKVEAEVETIPEAKTLAETLEEV